LRQGKAKWTTRGMYRDAYGFVLALLVVRSFQGVVRVGLRWIDLCEVTRCERMSAITIHSSFTMSRFCAFPGNRPLGLGLGFGLVMGRKLYRAWYS